MHSSLRKHIAELERSGELVRIKEFVDPVLEMAEIADRMAKSPKGGKALLFENTGTDFPVLMNMMGSEQRMCRVLGVSNYNEIGQRIDNLFNALLSPKQGLWDKLKLLPTLKQASQWMPRVVRKRGACQEVVMKEPQLSQLSILQCWPHDGGRFITLPMVHTKDPTTGMRNLGMYRMQVFSDTTTGMHWHKHKTGARHFNEFKEMVQGKRYKVKGKNLSPFHPLPFTRFPVAVALGGDSIYSFCAIAPMPDNMDEYLLAGFLRNKTVDLVPCLTQPLEVPADADFIIEGYIDVEEPLVIEGPFGDHTGFYSFADKYPLFHVTAITHRRDAVYPATVVGIPPQEDAYVGQAIEKIFLAPIRLTIAPEIRDIHIPFEGVVHNIVLVKINQQYEGQAIKVAHALWGAGQMMLNKIMIVIDENVPLNDYQAVMQLVAKHYRPEQDTYFSRGPLDILDHSTVTTGFGGKMCIDATRKMENGEWRMENEMFQQPNVIARRSQTDEATPPLTGNLNSNITFLFDKEVDTSDFSTCAWLLGNNVDPARDCKIENGKLIIDARSRGKAPRWPNIVCMDTATIAAIDKKWDKLGLGPLLSSPSIKFQRLVREGGAEVMNNE
ncbi:MAG: menaquinone biosynthesis decarboxylase [Prevotellaceae bacterium]|nr:menaquinone biosynthesis decarboxylase [Prevotellaceae bacterium]